MKTFGKACLLLGLIAGLVVAYSPAGQQWIVATLVPPVLALNQDDLNLQNFVGLALILVTAAVVLLAIRLAYNIYRYRLEQLADFSARHPVATPANQAEYQRTLGELHLYPFYGKAAQAWAVRNRARQSGHGRGRGKESAL